jgi:hypothetical protein
MSSLTKKPFSFTKLLRLACSALEILIVVGLLLTAIQAPLAERMVSKGSSVKIAKSATTGDFTYAFRLNPQRGVVVTNDSTAQLPLAAYDAGTVSVGPFSLKSGTEGQFFKGVKTDKDVDVQRVEAMVTFKGPERAIEALRAFKWPAITGEFCAILGGLAFFETVRRLLLSAEKGELFTESNVRTLRQVGFLIIVLDLFKYAAAGILLNRMNSFVSPFFSDGTWILTTTVTGKLTGVFTGLSFFLVAEVFREGVKFRKDSDLTI